MSKSTKTLMFLFSALVILMFKISTKDNGTKRNLYQPKNTHHSCEKEGSLTLLISDGSSESITQIIQCSNNSLKHGFATVVYPFDNIEKRDIIWEPEYENGGIKHPMRERRLSLKKIQTVSSYISELDTVAYREFWGGRDEYLYILYVNKRKVLTATEDMLGQFDFPLKYEVVLKSMISMGQPLYPNFGFLININ